MRNTLTAYGVGLVLAGVLAGCGATQKSEKPFFTSGSPEADQRADQRMARHEQIQGKENKGDTAEQAAARSTLFERLGGEAGLTKVVDDFVDRALADPRVNWNRKGVTTGGVLGIGDKSAEWKPSADAIARIKQHMTQFLAVATGGPTQYEGRQMANLHKGMKITNPEFDAAVGDLKATLDKLGVKDADQRELLAIIESTREQIVEVR